MGSRGLGLSTLTVLYAIAGGCRYGFDIIDMTGLQSGTVYRALSRLEDRGMLRSKWEAASHALKEKRPRRKYYEVTARGEQELATARKQLIALLDMPGFELGSRAKRKRS